MYVRTDDLNNNVAEHITCVIISVISRILFPISIPLRDLTWRTPARPTSRSFVKSKERSRKQTSHSPQQSKYTAHQRFKMTPQTMTKKNDRPINNPIIFSRRPKLRVLSNARAPIQTRSKPKISPRITCASRVISARRDRHIRTARLRILTSLSPHAAALFTRSLEETSSSSRARASVYEKVRARARASLLFDKLVKSRAAQNLFAFCFVHVHAARARGKMVRAASANTWPRGPVCAPGQ